MHERFSYDPLVIPYMIGFIFILIYIAVAVIKIFRDLPIADKKKMFLHLVNIKIFKTAKDIFLDCLLHVKIWKKNLLLGYMHTSIALGWFMIIFVGHIEIFLFAPHRLNLPYYPIFFRYFIMDATETVKGAFFFSVMDFFLLIILSGIALAFIKRIRRKLFGMKRTTKLKWNDQIAVYAMWLIFPLRLVAESFTVEISGGGFLTKGLGNVFGWFDKFVSNDIFIEPTWWAYSIVLMLFFLTLPWSRFTHILAEALLIYMRNAGIRESVRNNGYAGVELYSCSRCGICLDPCQLVSAATLRKMSSLEFLRNLRWFNKKAALDEAKHCLMCNRCVRECPVGINSVALKHNTKGRDITYNYKNRFDYTDNALSNEINIDKSAENSLENTNNALSDTILYFSGCMSHLTPRIEKAMIAIFKEAKQNFVFMDEDGGLCCGRPIYLAGDRDGAKQLIDKNTKLIKAYKAKTLVCSCPICYKIFKEMYELDSIEILHHSEYILRLIENGDICVDNIGDNVIYHDPCELARGLNIYEEPRKILNKTSNLHNTAYDKDDALCCGNSIASEALPYRKKKAIVKDAMNKMLETVDSNGSGCKAAHSAEKNNLNFKKKIKSINSKDITIVTACPSCKKSFNELNENKVEDIAEVVLRSLRRNK